MGDSIVAGDEDDIVSPPGRTGSTSGFPHHPLASIPHHCVSGFLSSNISNATALVALLWNPAEPGYDVGCGYGLTPFEEQVEVGSRLDGVPHTKTPVILCTETLAPFCASGRYDGTASLGRHAGTKTVGLGTAVLVGLVCTLHYSSSYIYPWGNYSISHKSIWLDENGVNLLSARGYAPLKKG